MDRSGATLLTTEVATRVRADVLSVAVGRMAGAVGGGMTPSGVEAEGRVAPWSGVEEVEEEDRASWTEVEGRSRGTTGRRVRGCCPRSKWAKRRALASA